MNRVIAAAATIALVAVPAAFAASNTYEGTVTGDSESSVVLKVGEEDGTRVVRAFTARDFAIKCEKGTQARLSSAKITGAVQVNDSDRFRIEGQDGKVEFTVAGKLKGKRSAKGTFSYEGPTEVDGDRLDCDSGNLDWKASR
jgi:hypothetical protein